MLNKFRKKTFLYFLVFILLSYLFLTVSLYIYCSDKIFPGIKIADYDVGLITPNETLNLLNNKIVIPEKIKIDAKNRSFDLQLSDVGFSYNLEKTIDRAFSSGKPKNIYNYLNPFTYFSKKLDLGFEINLDQNKLDEYLQVIAVEVSKEPTPPSAKLIDGKIIIHKGTAGEYLDKPSFRNDLLNRLSYKDFSEIELPFVIKDESLTDEETDKLNKRAEKLIGKTINLENEFEEYTIKDMDLISFIDARNNFDHENILNYIETKVSPTVNRDPQNAVFRFLPAQADEKGKVVEFIPGKNGAVINNEILINNIIEQISQLESSDLKTINITIPVKNTFPLITTADVNNFGIKELIGRGTSKFAGSIPGRVHNVGLASSKFAGILAAPGETISFNKILGDVSSYTGYKQAYIIKDGRTVLGDGGGVCQVSTTLFRAALNAGLPILERRAHSYRVGYYEQDSGPGMDATVYDPTSDLKIINDTPGHILIQSIYNKEKQTLAFEIYGTSDGRISTITKPVVTGVIAPPPDLYIDDPTLPIGQTKQIDHKAWGAKVSFNYKVERDGEILIEKTFYSNYRPWQSVFLRGTGSK